MKDSMITTLRQFQTGATNKDSTSGYTERRDNRRSPQRELGAHYHLVINFHSPSADMRYHREVVHARSTHTRSDVPAGDGGFVVVAAAGVVVGRLWLYQSNCQVEVDNNLIVGHAHAR